MEPLNLRGLIYIYTSFYIGLNHINIQNLSTPHMT